MVWFLVMSAHVAFPFAYPQYYQQEWLRFVRARDTRQRFGDKELDGAEVIAHGVYDVAAVAISDAAARVAMAAGIVDLTVGGDEGDRQVRPSQTIDSCAVGDLVELEGYSVEDSKEGDCFRRMSGRVSLVESNRVLVKTPVPSEMGMCGGPLFRSGGDGRLCLGILEGIVTCPNDSSPSPGLAVLLNQSVFVGQGVVSEFLSALESDVRRGVLRPTEFS
mmetsp:Transcript_8948/g.18009  ORF Transcript_8948/g.18009 Transcript_8948/m.18009 type:complete len:219 (+) Transcript_8948:392-1048(+)